MTWVDVRGGSIAGAALACLLRRAGFGVACSGQPGPRVPAVMVGAAVGALLADIFEMPGDPLAGLWRIDRRSVRWGDAPSTTLPHRAWVLTGESLNRWNVSADPAPADPSWRVFAGGPRDLPAGVDIQLYGDRQATAWPVTLRPGADAHACLAESLAHGWLFLLPVSGHEAWLLVVGDGETAESALASSQLVAGAVDRVSPGSGSTFACAPRFTLPAAAEGWLCCGSAAAAFDPLCGDGVGAALRQAILGAAVVDLARRQPLLAQPAAAHYQQRLSAAMLRHLEICHEFYSRGGSGSWWALQRSATASGVAALRSVLAREAAPQFRLAGFRLEEIEA